MQKITAFEFCGIISQLTIVDHYARHFQAEILIDSLFLDCESCFLFCWHLPYHSNTTPFNMPAVDSSYTIVRRCTTGYATADQAMQPLNLGEEAPSSHLPTNVLCVNYTIIISRVRLEMEQLYSFAYRSRRRHDGIILWCPA